MSGFKIKPEGVFNREMKSRTAIILCRYPDYDESDDFSWEALALPGDVVKVIGREGPLILVKTNRGWEFSVLESALAETMDAAIESIPEQVREKTRIMTEVEEDTECLESGTLTIQRGEIIFSPLGEALRCST